MVLYNMSHRHLDYPKLIYVKVAGMKEYPRQTWNFSSPAVSVCIGLWRDRLMHACHRPMHACAACIAPWQHRQMHAVTAWAVLFWFCLRYTHRAILLEATSNIEIICKLRASWPMRVGSLFVASVNTHKYILLMSQKNVWLKRKKKNLFFYKMH